MKQFKPGDMVRVIAGPRAGEVTTVRSVLRLTPRPSSPESFPEGLMVHSLALRSLLLPGKGVAAPPAWLEPFYPGKESSNTTTEEILNAIRSGVPAKERA
jgi:hypothetical protein